MALKNPKEKTNLLKFTRSTTAWRMGDSVEDGTLLYTNNALDRREVNDKSSLS
ncbi:hypothetical protein Csa_000869 [Cucumis sativus]|uniref:Uncharacterized protein n=1 Tax=Cucumis sativus TaxID=3659 RepID=A0A0A0LCD2_CUCSA|nr:hypothetical protein Csa_000869 [Cucumis sativus]